MLVIGLIGWTGVAQLVRGEFLRLGEQEFILAGRAPLGFSPFRESFFRHVLPNALAPVLVAATFGIAEHYVSQAAPLVSRLRNHGPQTFLGRNSFVRQKRDRRSPVADLFSRLAIFLTITAYNLVGEATP